jgi:hypothetical protein
MSTSRGTRVPHEKNNFISEERKAVLIAIAMLVIAANSYVFYFIPSIFVRISIILMFIVPWLIIYYYYNKASIRTWKFVLVLTLFYEAILTFIQRNLFLLSLSGISIGGSHNYAQVYEIEGRLLFLNAHSYFPQIPLIAYIITIICGLPLPFTPYLIATLYLTLLGILAIIILNFVNIPSSFRTLEEHIYIALAIFVVASQRISITIGYRDLELPLLLLLYTFLLQHGLKSVRIYVTGILLELASTLGSPLAALITAFTFLLAASLSKNARSRFVVYAIIPLAYIVYASTLYIYTFRGYFTFAMTGFIEFLKGVILEGRVSHRVLPWHRTQSMPLIDVYMASLGRLALLLLAIITSLGTFIFFIKNKADKEHENSFLYLSLDILLLLFLSIISFAYIGASVMPEAPFSDIRTILIDFVPVLSSLIFTQNMFSEKILRNKFIAYAILFLLALSSLGTLCSAYPKSIYDPINVVEDPRIDSVQKYYAEKFIVEVISRGKITRIISDYNPHAELLAVLQYRLGVNVDLLSNKTMHTQHNGFLLLFNVNGLAYPSLYISHNIYENAYKMCLNKDKIYSNYAIIICFLLS